jgi:glycosyltransferase involved in cell wall biosynthesis
MATNDAPLVTVIIATHNAGRFVNATIESALRQTFTGFELIVVDDGSTDDTLARLRSFQDHRLRIIEQSNQGQPAALNAGLGAGRGRYIALLDHDDLWKETKLERHVECLERSPGVDLTFSWSRLIDESDRDMGPNTRYWSGFFSFRQMLQNTVLGNASALVLRSDAMKAVGGFDPGFPFHNDMDILLRIALLRPNNICAVPEELNFYRWHRSQQSRDWRSMHDEWHKLLEKLRRLAPEDIAAVERRADSIRSCYYAYLAYLAGDFGPACRLLGSAIGSASWVFFTDPWHWKVAAACLAGLLLPVAMHRRLERLAGIQRDGRKSI